MKTLRILIPVLTTVIITVIAIVVVVLLWGLVPETINQGCHNYLCDFIGITGDCLVSLFYQCNQEVDRGLGISQQIKNKNN